MFEELSPKWSQIEAYLRDGFSLIPVREKEEVLEDVIYPVKTPFKSWKKYQDSIITAEQLWKECDRYDTGAIAIICGKVSGNLEVIDIDVKYKPGIDAQFFTDLYRIFPDLHEQLRIHRSPSGGYHVLYRIKDHKVPGNTKLSKLKSVAKGQPPCFIETRGEGGYVVCPPSFGYEIHQDVPIPIITWEQRESLINLALSYNEVVKGDPTTKLVNKQDEFYDKNPFVHFNLSDAAENILQDFGWKVCNSSGNFQHFTRPGKSSGVSASFIRHKRLYHIFTSSTEFESDRSYLPSTVLAILKFQGDSQACYRYLAAEGYGVIKPDKEETLVRRLVQTGENLPANISPQAKAKAQAQIKASNEDHPYGTFWEPTKTGFVINREHMMTVAGALGFTRWNGLVVERVGHLLHKRDEWYLIDALKSYIHEQDARDYNRIVNAFEKFMEEHRRYCIARLPQLDESIIITDTRDTAFKFFRDGLVTIKADSIEHTFWGLTTGAVWADLVQTRDWDPEPPVYCKYTEFLELACRLKDRRAHIQTIIGYLAHNYKDESLPYFIVITEEVPDPKQGGGSGKNIFCSLLKYSTTFLNVAGSQIKFDEKFLQAWNFERVMAISDAPKHFDFAFLKELSSGSATLKKLFKDEISLSFDVLPKFIIQTNHSYELVDGGVKRRLIPLEFTDFFTKSGGVDTHFGCLFPVGWNQTDWCGYDHFIAQSIQAWFKAGLKLSNPELSEGGWTKQFNQTYGQLTREFIQENWPEWSSKRFISNEDFKREYDTFCQENGVAKNYMLSSLKMNAALSAWAIKHSYVFDKDARLQTNSIRVRGRGFTEKAPF
jgi:hypothetical protein